jgi:hypothetical protein
LLTSNEHSVGKDELEIWSLIRHLLDKHWEFDKDVVIIFIDFEKQMAS